MTEALHLRKAEDEDKKEGVSELRSEPLQEHAVDKENEQAGAKTDEGEEIIRASAAPGNADKQPAHARMLRMTSVATLPARASAC